MSRASPVPSFFLSAALCVFVMCGPQVSFSDEGQSAPAMALKQQIHDFRDALEGEFLEHTFEVLNRGDEPLVIERVKPDCSCSVVDVDPSIPPNGEGRIKVRIDTKGFDGPERWVVKVFRKTLSS